MSSFKALALLYLILGGLMLDKDRVKELYLQGYNAVEIAHKIKAKTEAVRKSIQRNLNNFDKERHEEALRIRRVY